jgi:hypothetical protein
LSPPTKVIVVEHTLRDPKKSPLSNSRFEALLLFLANQRAPQIHRPAVSALQEQQKPDCVTAHLKFQL